MEIYLHPEIEEVGPGVVTVEPKERKLTRFVIISENILFQCNKIKQNRDFLKGPKIIQSG